MRLLSGLVLHCATLHLKNIKKMNSLKTKYDKYLKLLPTQQDFYGFVDSKHCDSLLFTGLLGCDPNVKVYIEKAMGQPGQWFRRPIYNSYGELDFKKECFTCGQSKSTISRDMILGLCYYIYYNKRLDLSEQLIKYALKNSLIIGKAVDFSTLFGRCFLSPGLLSTLAWISYRLGGPSRPWLRHLPQFESKSVVDFQAHLSVLHILLRAQLTGKNRHKKLLEAHYNRQPKNPLFCIATGRKEQAETILLDNSLFPEDRLPTTHDRYVNWLPMRDDGKDWLPDLSSPATCHSGADYIFLYWLLNNYEPRGA